MSAVARSGHSTQENTGTSPSFASVALCRWGAGHPGHDPARFISPTALMLSMTANVDRAAAAGRPLVAGMTAGRESFTLRPDDRGALDVVPGLHDGRAFTLTGTGNTLARAVYGRRPLAALAAEGLVAVDGDPAAAQAFADLFTLRQAA